MKIKKLLFIPVCLMLAGCASKSNDVVVQDELNNDVVVSDEVIEETDYPNDYARVNAAYEDFDSKLNELMGTNELSGRELCYSGSPKGYWIMIRDNNIEDGDVCKFTFSNDNGETASIKGWFEYSYGVSTLDDFFFFLQINIVYCMLYKSGD